MGVKLLDRTHQGIEPTEYGRALLDGGAAVFDDLRRAVKNIEFLADPTVGEVRVGSNEAMIAGLIPTVSSRIRRDHPGISIQVTPRRTSRSAIESSASAGWISCWAA